MKAPFCVTDILSEERFAALLSAACSTTAVDPSSNLVLQVCVDNVLKTMKENANKASSILLTAIPHIGQMDWTHTMKTLKVRCQLHDSFHSSIWQSCGRGTGNFFFFSLIFFYYLFIFFKPPLT